jgi:hypothetical protein
MDRGGLAGDFEGKGNLKVVQFSYSCQCPMVSLSICIYSKYTGFPIRLVVLDIFAHRRAS